MNKLIQFCISFRNAIRSHNQFFIVDYDKLTFNFLQILFTEGLIDGAVLIPNNKIKVIVKYNFLFSSSVKEIVLISTPSNHIYINYKMLSKIIKLDTIFLFTSKGILSGANSIKQKLGGKIICSLF